MSEPTLNLVPSDILGIVQRGLRELDFYLNKAPNEIDAAMVQQHLARMSSFVSALVPAKAADKEAA